MGITCDFQKTNFCPTFLCVYFPQISTFLWHSFPLFLLNDFYHLMAICPVYSKRSAKENGKMHAPKVNPSCLSHCTNIFFVVVVCFLENRVSDRVNCSAKLLSQICCFPFHLTFCLLCVFYWENKHTCIAFAVQRLDRMHLYVQTSERV